MGNILPILIKYADGVEVWTQQAGDCNSIIAQYEKHNRTTKDKGAKVKAITFNGHDYHFREATA